MAKTLKTYLALRASLLLPLLAPLLLVAPDIAHAASLGGLASSIFGAIVGTPVNWFLTLIATLVGSVLGFLSSIILHLSTALFDFIFKYTVLQFGAIADTGLMTAINTAWSAFRDLANIIIIAMFVFVAIQTILGSHEYGARKMIARLLIVAVLINFSLLFTKLIIDASNFISVQMYASMQFPAAPTEPGQPAQSAGVAYAFEDIAGIPSIADNAGNIYKAGTSENGNALIAFGYAVLTSLLLLTAAMVFFYGSFLLISRALLFIFLMLSSSIAFATYLIPGAAKGKFGWNVWWSALLKNAALAPLLTILLWVSFTVGQAFKHSVCTAAGGNCGGLGDIATNYSDSYIAALLGYIIVIGLLFISFRIAASFSKEIGGFDYASMATALPFASTARYIAAPMLRNKFGGDALAREHMFEHDIESESRRLSQLPINERDYSALTKLMKGKESAAKNAHRTYDLMNTKVGQAIGKATGLPSTLTEKDKTNFAESAKTTAEAAAKKATEAAISKNTAKEALAGDAEIRERREGLKLQKEAAEAAMRTSETVASQKKDLERLNEAMHQEKNTLADAQRKRSDADEAFLNKRISQEDHKRLIQEQDERIKTANKTVKTIQSRMDFHDQETKQHKEKLSEIQRQEKSLEKEIDKRATAISTESTKVAQEMAAKFAGGMSNKMANSVANVFRKSVRDDTTAAMARDLVKKKVGARRVKAQVQAQNEIVKDAGEAPSTPSGDSHH